MKYYLQSLKNKYFDNIIMNLFNLILVALFQKGYKTLNTFARKNENVLSYDASNK